MHACSTRRAPPLLGSLFVTLACASTSVEPVGVAADAGAPAPISQAEWSALTAPRAGVHEVWSEACDGVRIEPEYRVVPPIACYPRRDADGVASDTRDCRLEDYCQTSADCTARAGGVCRGSVDSRCAYPGSEEQPCDSDAECVTLPGGSCRPRLLGGGSSCYPTGECRRTPLQSCSYPALNVRCQSDTECSAAPGGHCERWVVTGCLYNECDDSCGAGARCECQSVRTCVPADCLGDAECGAGFRCESSLDVSECAELYPPAAYHCHTPRDACLSDAECGAGHCVFDPALGAWSCRTFNCVTR